MLGNSLPENARVSTFDDTKDPDLLFLAFLDFLAFFLSKEFLVFFCAFLPSYPRILGVRQG